MTTFTKTETIYFDVYFATQRRDEGRWGAEVELQGHIEHDHGADADGNRGQDIDVIDDYEILSWTDPEGNIINDDENLPKEVKAAAEREISKL